MQGGEATPPPPGHPAPHTQLTLTLTLEATGLSGSLVCSVVFPSLVQKRRLLVCLSV